MHKIIRFVPAPSKIKFVWVAMLAMGVAPLSFQVQLANRNAPPSCCAVARDVFVPLSSYPHIVDVTVHSTGHRCGQHFVAAQVLCINDEYWFKGMGSNFRRACEDCAVKVTLRFASEQYEV